MNITLAQRITLRLLGFVGSAIFILFFSLTYSVPGWVEDFAASYIESKVEERIDSTIDAIRPPDSENALARLAQSVYNKNEERIEGLKRGLKDKVHERWASALAEIRDLDCECRQTIANRLEKHIKADIGLLQAGNEKITEFIHSKYMSVATDLKADIRIFTGGNAAVFLFLLIVSFMKPKAITHLFLPGVLLTISTAICSYFYIFQTDWLLTIIQGSYLGYAYLAWLGVVFLFLCDIVFNSARITTEVINAILNAIGSALSVAPC